jgi:hypothetical protein
VLQYYHIHVYIPNNFGETWEMADTFTYIHGFANCHIIVLK